MMPIAKKATKYDTNLKVLAWGEPGAGKTRLALSFPAPLVIDLERGSRLYADEFDFLVAEPTPALPIPSLVKAVVEEISKGEYPDRKTLIIDPITDYLDHLEWQLIEQKRKAGVNLEALKGPQAGKVRHEIKDGIKERLDAILRLPMHVVFIAREKNNWDGSQVTGKKADVHELVESLCDIVINLKRGGVGEIPKSRLVNLPSSIRAMTFADLEQAMKDAPKLGGPTQTPPASVIKPNASKTA